MFDFISNSVKKIFGTKYDRDVKAYSPVVEEINEIYEELQGLSNDGLRNQTLEFRRRIAEYLSEVDEEMAQLRREAEEVEDLHRKEEIFRELDELQEERDKHLEEILKEILPAAFAVVKETARRFSQNQTLTVTATDHDRDLGPEVHGFSDFGGIRIQRSLVDAVAGLPHKGLAAQFEENASEGSSVRRSVAQKPGRLVENRVKLGSVGTTCKPPSESGNGRNPCPTRQNIPFGGKQIASGLIWVDVVRFRDATVPAVSYRCPS